MRKQRNDKKPIAFFRDHSADGKPILRYAAHIPDPKAPETTKRKFGQLSDFGHDEVAALEWWMTSGYGQTKVVSIIQARKEKALPKSDASTFQDFAELWTSGKLRNQYPDTVRDKDHTRDLEVLRLHIYPHIGSRPIDTLTLDDCEKVIARLPRTLAPHTRKLIAQCMSKVFSYAVYPGRLIERTPMIKEMIPKAPKQDARAKSFLYPSEDKKLLACQKIPLVRRMAYGVLMREGMRASELANLRWSDLDLDLGTISLDENKTDNPRTWKLSPDVVRVLSWWQKENVRADDLVLGCSLGDGAWWLHGDAHYNPRETESTLNNPGDLRRAGITRKQLWEDTETRHPFRLHDLRGSFVTLHLAAGKTEAWVTDRTGHQSSEMIYRYKRAARMAEELDLGLPVEMDSVLSEFPKRKPAKKRG